MGNHWGSPGFLYRGRHWQNTHFLFHKKAFCINPEMKWKYLILLLLKIVQDSIWPKQQLPDAVPCVDMQGMYTINFWNSICNKNRLFSCASSIEVGWDLILIRHSVIWCDTQEETSCIPGLFGRIRAYINNPFKCTTKKEESSTYVSAQVMCIVHILCSHMCTWVQNIS